MSEPQKKIVFIINPISGIRRKKAVEDAIARYLDHSFSYEIAYTEHAHHASEISKNASLNGADIIISVGGDGSANDVAQGLVHTRTIMGIIPQGSGNGLAHHMQIPFSLKKAIDVINRQKVSRIDTATINDRLFISIAGVGFDALVAEEFAKCRRRGFSSYFKTVLKQFRIYRPSTYKITFDGKEIERPALLVSFANSDQFGYNARIAPKAMINDGFIDLCIVRPVSFLTAARLAHKLFRRTIDKSKNVEVYKTKEIFIETTEDVSLHIDGDPQERIRTASVRIFPESLNLIVP